MFGDRVHDLVDTLRTGRDGPDHRRLPPLVAGRPGQGDHVFELPVGVLRAVPVGLVDHEHVGDLQDAGLGRLDAVAHPRCQQHQRGVGQRGDVDLGLAHPHRLDEHHVEAGRVQHAQRLRGRPGQPTEMPSGGQRADVDAGVGGVLLHAHPVPEQRAAAERGRRVDGQDADPQVTGAERADKSGRRGRLAHPGGAGEADHLRPPGAWRQQGHDLPQLRGGVLHQGDQPGERPWGAGNGGVHQVGRGDGARPDRPGRRERHRGRAHAGTRSTSASP